MRLRTKRFAWPALLVFGLPALLALAWVVAWLALSPVVEQRLEALLERRFDADVEIASLHYLPPYWVRASGAVLRSELGGEAVEWIRVRSARARLDRIPGTGPIAIEKLTLVDPTVTLLEHEGRMRDPSDLWRSTRKRRSGKLPLREIVARDLTVVYRARAEGGVAAEPLRLGGFALELRVDAGGARAYDVDVSGGSERLRIDAAARLELRERVLRVAALDASTALPADRSSSEGGKRGGSATRIRLGEAKGTIALRAGRWRLDDGRLSFGGDPPLELRELRGTARTEQGRVEVRELHAAALGGTVDGSLTVRSGKSRRWSATLAASDVDVARLTRRFAGGGVRGRLAADLDLAAPLTADRDALLSGLSGEGTVRVTDGRLYEIPVIAALLDAVQIGSDAATVSDASTELSVADRVVRLDDLALGSPSIGMQGGGEVGFDGHVDLDVVVVPLGDWKQKLEATDVPIVEDAIATIAGALQSLFSEASGVVYEFRVTGSLADPSVTPVPAPMLTRSAATLFARMVSGSWQEGLVSGRSPRRPNDADSPRASRE